MLQKVLDSKGAAQHPPGEMSRKITFLNLLNQSLRRTSQRALAREIGVDHSRVCRWAAGQGLPSGGTFLPLAAALGVSLDDLVHAINCSTTRGNQ